ncbi:organic cation transporter protein-like [Asterias rubens]|uniref:organic cation transporter protein-like n=1 Tax=Asterias rubens TaxID=7604 RepID=UPI001455B167|nr:organic cation transporter protein-like [Asterias rubens]
MDVDKSLRVLGSFGRLQALNYFTYVLAVSVAAWHITGVSFTIGQPDNNRCRIPENETSFTTPLDDGCHQIVYYDNDTDGDNETMACTDGWEYDTVHGETSVVTDLNLVCDRAILGSTLQSVHFGGCLLGSYVTGQMSDIFGRRLTLLGSLVGIVVTGTGFSFAQSYGLMSFLKFLHGCFIPGLILVPYVRIIEMFPPSFRVRSHLGCEMLWCLGLVLVGPLAYILPNWRHLQLVMSLLAAPLILLVWYSYESVRWLLQKGRVDEAEKIFQRISKSKNISHVGGYFVLPQQEQEHELTNGSSRPELSDEKPPLDIKASDYNRLESDVPAIKDAKKYTLLDLFRTRALAIRTLIVLYCWFACSAVYYGFFLISANLVGNMYVNFTLMSLTEAPCYIANYFVTIRFGRRRPLITYFIVSGVACVITGLIPDESGDGTDLSMLKLGLAMIGRFFASTAFDLTYLVTIEMFPTVLRNAAAGAASLIGRVGGMVAPFIVFLNVIHSSIPFIVFGVVSLIAGMLVFPLPETNNRSLPETLDDGEKLAEKDEAEEAQPTNV